MLIEGYLAKIHTYPKDEIKIVVTVSAKSILAPSWGLLEAYKAGRFTWGVYERIFRLQMTKSPEAMAEMRRIKELAKIKDVRLICYEKEYPCHRFILIEIINEMV